MNAESWTGGCQCGSVRFVVKALGRASICHCHMCQRAFNAPFGALITAQDLVWTGVEPKRFRSSNKARRGFCGDCGSPLTLEYDDLAPEVAICAFDRAQEIAPVIQVGIQSRLPWVEGLSALPPRPIEEQAAADAFFADVSSYQWKDKQV